MEPAMTWDEYFCRMLKLVAFKSKDPSTKVGAIIVGPDKEIRSTGYNGLLS
jgi:dCMP deaminase